MKWKAVMLSILMVSFLGVYADNVSVELIPNNTKVDVGETFNLTLLVKNVPDDTKCAGLGIAINYYSNLNLTNIQLSDVANTAGLKDINESGGKISLAWFSECPSGNFTIATLTFKRIGLEIVKF